MYTLLLTLRDRGQYTESFFWYLNQLNFSEKILVADGSTDHGRLMTKEVINKYTNLNIEYHDFGFDDSYEKYYIKLKNAVSFIKTEYVIFVDNDDYINPRGCMDSCRFLSEDTSVAACGRIADLYFFPRISSCKIRTSRSILEGKQKERLQAFFQNPDSIWGLMLRVSGLINVFNAVQAANFEQLHLMELLFNLQVLQSGKVARVGSKPILYRRAFSEESSSAEALRDYSLLDKIFMNGFSKQWAQVENFYLNLGNKDLKALRMYWCTACISQVISGEKNRQRDQGGLYSSKLIFLRSLYYRLRFRDSIPRLVMAAESIRNTSHSIG